MNTLRHSRNIRYRLHSTRKQLRLLLAKGIIDHLRAVSEHNKKLTTLLDHVDKYNTPDSDEYRWKIAVKMPTEPLTKFIT
jgi:hypothetical protein